MTVTTVRTVKNYIGGKWIESASENTETVYNPATGEEIAIVKLSTREEVNEAVEVAHEAFKSWSQVPVPKRGRILFKYQQLLVEHWDELAKLVTIENGKSFAEAHGKSSAASNASSLLQGSRTS